MVISDPNWEYSSFKSVLPKASHPGQQLPKYSCMVGAVFPQAEPASKSNNVACILWDFVSVGNNVSALM